MATEKTIECARLALPHLVECAKRGETITYGELGAKIDVHPRAVSHFLYYIRDEICVFRGLPLLTAIVVHKSDGKPGESWLPEGTQRLTEAEQEHKFEQACREVFAYQDWDDLLGELGLLPTPDGETGGDVRNQMISLTREFDALKNRVRNVIGDSHWQTEGEWKESVLRTILRRYVPATIGVGRGFVVRLDRSSTQIDVLLYDTSAPVLHRDGDLVIVTPDAVRGIIEVKTKIRGSAELATPLCKLAQNAQLAKRHSLTRDDLFIGLFAYETPMAQSHGMEILETMRQCADRDCCRVVTHLSLGDDLFARFWARDPDGGSVLYNHWHIYELTKRAPAYFVNNVVAFMAHKSVSRNSLVWFDPAGKEPSMIARLPFRENGGGG